MKFFIINSTLPDSLLKLLLPYGEPIVVPPFEKLDFPVNAHPDMRAVSINGKLFIHESDTLISDALAKRDLPHTLCKTNVGAKYPSDIGLNLFTIKNFLFANTAHASTEVLEHAKLCGYETVNVAQGYAKCSTLLLDDALVTADTGIYRAAKERGIDALLIRPGYIGIEKYDTGFIGGASAKIAEGKIAVFGDIRNHPDGEKIIDFAKNHGTEILCLTDSQLFDYGGIVCA
jgi:hypothetical protein